MSDTDTESYAAYLIAHQESWLNRLLSLPYACHISSLRLGKTLDVGCGAGRNLKHLGNNSIGIDHNSSVVKYCRSQKLKAFTTEEWATEKNAHLGQFDSVLFSHVAEHMPLSEFERLVESMLPLLKKEGVVVVICPQESGYSSDATHVEFVGFEKVGFVFNNLKIRSKKHYSFPFIRSTGKIFRHNEFVSIGVKIV